ncbi:DNA polymerase IV [Aedoeadaptatus coxii]|uniref:DNA polymerase IV n=1 Tax=Aedoeadaptatus coxii TaxID=755172 RepID=UPI002AD590C6|nr:DNA polymerase IV [Peptoniphilus coxii]
MERVILHSDMNSCYASIEIQKNPALRGKPVVVGGHEEDRHGIVLAKSQEAKAYGIQTAEPLWEAHRKCPNLIVVSPHYDDYLDFSRWARKIYYDYTNQVEPFGLDECWLDVTGSVHLFGSGETIAHTIRKRIKKELGITVSIGVSFTKTFAKLGSDMKKPDAVTVIPKDQYRSIVYPLPVGSMIGIGRKTKEKLNRLGIITLGDLARTEPMLLGKRLGVVGVKLWQKVWGFDDDPVADYDYRPEIKTVGNGITLREDLLSDVEVRRILQILSFKVSRRLREYGLEAEGIDLHLKDSHFVGYSFQSVLPYGGQTSFLLRDGAFDLYRSRYDGRLPIRAITLRAIRLVPEKHAIQRDMFSDYDKQKKEEALDKALHGIKARYGDGAVTFLGLLEDTKMPRLTTDIVTLPHGYQR